MTDDSSLVDDLLPRQRAQVRKAWLVAAALAAFVFGVPLLVPDPGNLLSTALLLAMFLLPVAVLGAAWSSLSAWFRRN